MAPPQSGTAIRQAIRAVWPICLGYIPIGLAFGVLAEKAGLRPVEIGLMSLLVFAGSSQFIAVSMIAGGAAATAIILTTFVVNLRHLLMSSALAVYLKNRSRRSLALFAYGITDESFAVNLAKFNQGNWGAGRGLIVNQTANGVWILSTVAGGYGGQFIPSGAFGIDYALNAMFVCLLIFQLRGPVYAATALLAGIAAVLFALIIPGNGYIILGAVLAATLGVAMQRRSRKDVT